ncbi:nuclear transport factor 2 family protein [Larkinella ripae]
MKLTNQQIAEAFSKHEFELTYPYLSDAIQWNLVGSERIRGKEGVMQTCKESAAYFDTVTTTFAQFVVLTGDDFVVIDSLADYQDAQQQTTRIASCDIYRFTDGKLSDITSYTADVSDNE